MNVLFIISEVEDIIKTGGLADVGKALPIALRAIDHKVTIVLPYYKEVSAQFDLMDAMPPQQLIINTEHYPFKVKHLNFHGIDTYLIDHEYFSASNSPYGPCDMASNAQKFTLFSIAALSIAATINFVPDIVHCNDWHTAMVPYLLRSDYLKRHNVIADHNFFDHSRSVLTVHNAAFQGVAPLDSIPLIGHDDLSPIYIENGYINMLRTGILHADKICAVSPRYAEEIKSPLGSHGISDVINLAPQKVVGVLNGCDYTQWDPSNDEFIPANFSMESMSGKAICKAQLQKDAGLPALKTVPLIGMVCRATRQKGFDFLLPILGEFLKHKVQIVIMGTGDKRITERLFAISKAHSEKFAFVEAFKPKWAHLIEAGSDFFLMPSEFEPCGLNQMYSLAYGTLPIVRKVGGLADTVVDVRADFATGFIFEHASSEDLLSTLRLALLTYQESPAKIKRMVRNAMQTRFTWEEAANQYAEVYRSI